MCKRISILLVFTLLVSCQRTNPLHAILNCDVNRHVNTILVQDFNENFSLSIPRHWKINHYYDQFKSEIYAADTTRELTDTYIFDASFNNGSLVFDDYFFKRIDSVLSNEQLELMNSGTVELNENIGYWYLVNGTKNGYPYHKFNLSFPCGKDTYFNTFTELYGDTQIQERLCDSFNLLDNLEFSE
jgi:hypothetical protein